jgi:sporulation protein YlmC with PRC-barrel domain
MDTVIGRTRASTRLLAASIPAVAGLLLLAVPAAAQQQNQTGSSVPAGGSQSVTPQPSGQGGNGQGMPVTFAKEQELGQWRASKLVGLDVLGAEGNKIGDIRDALVDADGRVAVVVIGTGGMLGVGEKLVGVPFQAIEFSARSEGATRNTPANSEAATTGSVAPGTSTNATRDAFVTRGGTPDHAILRVTKADLEKAPSFAYAGRSGMPSSPQGAPGSQGVDGPPPATPPQQQGQGAQP